MSDHMSDSSKFEVVTVDAMRMDHSPARRFRRWSAEEKRRIISSTFEPGANVSAIARRHDIDPSQLFAWRRKALSPGGVTPLMATDQASKFTRFEAINGGMVEIVVGEIVVRVRNRVDPDHLTTIIRAVRKA